MRLTRRRTLGVFAALGAPAIATGGVPAVQANAKAAYREIEADEVIHACRHPNGGCA